MEAKRGHGKRKYENTMPVIEEGWWESVLAEERLYARPAPGTAKPKPAAPSKADVQPAMETTEVDWAALQDLYAKDQIVSMKVCGYNRGGLLVENGRLAGFIPFSHLIELAGKEHEGNRDVRLETYVGKTLQVKVIECVPEDGRAVFSERAALAEPGRRTQLFQHLEAGSKVKGVVTNITDFGVFVDLGGVEGLIHLSELSWGRVTHPSQIVRLGEEIEVQVLDVSPERCRVALSLKRLLPNPWDSAEIDFPVGSIQPAVITSVMSYGAFARIEAGVEGLIHGSEMILEPNQSPRDVLSVGQAVRVRILHLDAEHQRMGLSMILEPPASTGPGS